MLLAVLCVASVLPWNVNVTCWQTIHNSRSCW